MIGLDDKLGISVGESTKRIEKYEIEIIERKIIKTKESWLKTNGKIESRKPICKRIYFLRMKMGKKIKERKSDGRKWRK